MLNYIEFAKFQTAYELKPQHSRYPPSTIFLFVDRGQLVSSLCEIFQVLNLVKFCVIELMEQMETTLLCCQ